MRATYSKYILHKSSKPATYIWVRLIIGCVQYTLKYGNAVLLMHTAKLIRNEIFKVKESTGSFNGSFDKTSQENSVPSALVSLIGMLLKDQEILRPVTIRQLCR